MKQTVKKAIKSCKDWMEQPSDIKHIHYLNLSQEDVMEVRFKKAIKSALADQKAKIRKWLFNNPNVIMDFNKFDKEFEELN